MGTYQDSLGNEHELLQSKDSVKWDSEKLLDEIDATVPSTASNADYVAALRRMTSITYRPHRMRSLMAGELGKAFQSVHDGPSGLRPLNEETDDILADEFRKSEWHDLWRTERDVRCPALPRVAADSGVAERLDALRDVQDACLLAKDALKTWQARAVYLKKAGEYAFDGFGSPVGKVTSGMEVQGPQHTVINEALEHLSDPKAIREAYTHIASIRGGILREMRKKDLDPDDYRETTPGRWRVKNLIGN